MNVTMRKHSSAPTLTSLFLFSRNFIGKIPTSSIPSPEDPILTRKTNLWGCWIRLKKDLYDENPIF